MGPCDAKKCNKELYSSSINWPCMPVLRVRRPHPIWLPPGPDPNTDWTSIGKKSCSSLTLHSMASRLNSKHRCATGKFSRSAR